MMFALGLQIHAAQQVCEARVAPDHWGKPMRRIRS